MKKMFLILAVAMVSYYSKAQTNTFPSSGKVGIGTISPSEVLTIRDPNIAYDSSSGIVNFKFDSGSGGGGIGFEKESFNTGGLRFYTQYGYNNKVEKMRITSNGNVGIGTISPQTTLDVMRNGVNGLGLAAPVVFRTDAKTINDGISIPLQALNSSNTIKTYASIYSIITDPVSGTEDAFLNFSSIVNGISTVHMTLIGGNVGIGTATPDAKLTVNGTSILKK